MIVFRWWGGGLPQVNSRFILRREGGTGGGGNDDVSTLGLTKVNLQLHTQRSI